MPAKQLSEAIHLYKAGLPLKQVAAQIGCSAETIRQALLAAGITLRRQWERGPL
jgi:hypothetical protein